MYTFIQAHRNYASLSSSPPPLLLQKKSLFFLPPYNNNDFVITYQPGLTVDISKTSSCPDRCAAKSNKMFTTLPSLLWSAGKLTFFLRKRSEAVNNGHCCYRRALTFCNNISGNKEPSTSPLFGFVSPMYILCLNGNARDLGTKTSSKNSFPLKVWDHWHLSNLLLFTLM